MITVTGERQENSGGIAVSMKRQPIYPLCIEAVDEWKRRTVYNACEVSMVNALQNAGGVVWIDKPLFSDALADLLEVAARSSAKDKDLKLTVATSGVSSVHLLIEYAPQPQPEGGASALAHPESRFSGETRQIISQHGACLEFSEGGNSHRIMIRIP